MATKLPFKISVLIFVRNNVDQHLLIKRSKSPNKGCWSPIGGKLDQEIGESPYECARRETMEEIGLQVSDTDLHCFGYISEKSYEGTGHWLMFLFNCNIQTDHLPATIDEGHFRFFSRGEIDQLDIPKTDRTLLWPYYDKYRGSFVGIRADCDPQGQLHIVEEMQLPETQA